MLARFADGNESNSGGKPVFVTEFPEAELIGPDRLIVLDGSAEQSGIQGVILDPEYFFRLADMAEQNLEGIGSDFVYRGRHRTDRELRYPAVALRRAASKQIIERLDYSPCLMLIDDAEKIRGVLLRPAEYELLHAAAVLHQKAPMYRRRLAATSDAWQESESLPW
ncbi:hypothetical protein [Bradyrhizobium sp. SZCCHNRI1009]|uniref:hypothetical protein n=1 Tax=Bradyrhizobium sp. SZCCHNRI1009 TaxID=3057277 RepID=UPI002916411E|nr:hypothetical protein [Bradyrhizobium sp. SZCCHNRI1009]